MLDMIKKFYADLEKADQEISEKRAEKKELIKKIKALSAFLSVAETKELEEFLNPTPSKN